jgi:hypothetical protein
VRAVGKYVSAAMDPAALYSLSLAGRIMMDMETSAIVLWFLGLQRAN